MTPLDRLCAQYGEPKLPSLPVRLLMWLSEYRALRTVHGVRYSAKTAWQTMVKGLPF